MVKYKGGLQNFSFQMVRSQYPSVQRRVYDLLLSMTPERLQFEFSLIPKDYKFSSAGMDQNTLNIIGTVMSLITGEKNLIMTSDDVLLSYFRFQELIFLYEAIQQKLIVVKVTETSIEYYFDVEDIQKQPKLYHKLLPHYTGKITYAQD